ncbi:MAG: type II toxin-antitoxin system RelE/ParE family toxin [Phycisphaeraceae bacterium]
MARIFLTDRALDDLESIYQYSIDRWGRRVADRYLESYDSAFDLLRSEPALLKENPDCPGWLRFYRVQKHWVVCDQVGKRIYVLTIKHGAMDLPARLGELEPWLMQEAAMMRKRIDKK